MSESVENPLLNLTPESETRENFDAKPGLPALPTLGPTDLDNAQDTAPEDGNQITSDPEDDEEEALMDADHVFLKP